MVYGTRATDTWVRRFVFKELFDAVKTASDVMIDSCDLNEDGSGVKNPKVRGKWSSSPREETLLLKRLVSRPADTSVTCDVGATGSVGERKTRWVMVSVLGSTSTVGRSGLRRHDRVTVEAGLLSKKKGKRSKMRKKTFDLSGLQNNLQRSTVRSLERQVGIETTFRFGRIPSLTLIHWNHDVSRIIK
ncbi:hypothetical protein F2P81_021523 [Scophthalmus maximus]|uniref:Uncharacterized protein n=1 Tax=Scophthalmus maximus TaxID=52904 RepID=A0A6A4RVK8_SCOMX|nr:hypothetical protein F2P81_021523 [Scophthalmus maximus]